VSIGWLAQFSVVLLDMNGTFMFGHDRIGPGQDYFETYRRLGGQRLDGQRVQQIMVATCNALLLEYERPERVEDFPTLIEAFRAYGQAPESELPLLENVFAAHEIGHVPLEHGAFLAQAATSHCLGIVSNICARPEPWLELLRRAELLPLFTCTVFSSQGRSIKPSRSLFDRALAAFPPRSRVLFVGDSLERDIIPAKALGLATAWIAPAGSTHPDADRVITTLPDLATLAG
jgi:FMN phosphatase YigB (HAD superfamily)